MAISGGWRSYAYNCIFVVYTKKNQGKYFLSGTNQGIIREFHFWISVATLIYFSNLQKPLSSHKSKYFNRNVIKYSSWIYLCMTRSLAQWGGWFTNGAFYSQLHIPPNHQPPTHRPAVLTGHQHGYVIKPPHNHHPHPSKNTTWYVWMLSKLLFLCCNAFWPRFLIKIIPLLAYKQLNLPTTGLSFFLIGASCLSLKELTNSFILVMHFNLTAMLQTEMSRGTYST